MEKHPWTNIGFDESNHGLYPEVCVLVSSDNPDDILKRKKEDKLPKPRRNHSTIKERLENVDYSFLFFDLSDEERLINNYNGDYRFKKLGIIIASLLYKERLGKTINLFIDGDHYEANERDYVAKTLIDVTGKRLLHINIIYEGHMDQYYNVVNIADELAHCLLPNSRFKELRDSKKRKRLRLDDYISI